jgi:hypothetical protein
MKKRLKIVTLLIFICNYSFSQFKEKEIVILKNYSYFNQKSYLNIGRGNWNKKCLLNNGLVYQEENYLEKKLMSEQKYIYDDYGNLLFEISTYNINSGNKIDTIFKYQYKYDEFNRVIEKEYSFGMVEKFSKFDNNSKPKLIERFYKDNKTLYFRPINEFRDFDENGNLIKEIKTEIEYPESESDTIKKIKIETNTYKYDKYGNVIEIKRSYNPEESFPIIMIGGLPLYETEKMEYKYDKFGLWTKKYWIAGGKKILLYKRKFIK